MKASHGLTLALVIFGAGCGAQAGDGGGSSNSGPAPIPVSTPVVLTGLTLTPSQASIYVGDAIKLAVSGAFSDGTITPVNCTWQTSDPTVLPVPVTATPNISATGLNRGSATLTAHYGALNTQAVIDVVDWSVPA